MPKYNVHIDVLKTGYLTVDAETKEEAVHIARQQYGGVDSLSDVISTETTFPEPTDPDDLEMLVEEVDEDEDEDDDNEGFDDDDGDWDDPESVD